MNPSDAALINHILIKEQFGAAERYRQLLVVLAASALSYFVAERIIISCILFALFLLGFAYTITGGFSMSYILSSPLFAKTTPMPISFATAQSSSSSSASAGGSNNAAAASQQQQGRQMKPAARILPLGYGGQQQQQQQNVIVGADGAPGIGNLRSQQLQQQQQLPLVPTWFRGGAQVTTANDISGLLSQVTDESSSSNNNNLDLVAAGQLQHQQMLQQQQQQDGFFGGILGGFASLLGGGGNNNNNMAGGGGSIYPSAADTFFFGRRGLQISFAAVNRNAVDGASSGASGGAGGGKLQKDITQTWLALGIKDPMKRTKQLHGWVLSHIKEVAANIVRVDKELGQQYGTHDFRCNASLEEESATDTLMTVEAAAEKQQQAAAAAKTGWGGGGSTTTWGANKPTTTSTTGGGWGSGGGGGGGSSGWGSSSGSTTTTAGQDDKNKQQNPNAKKLRKLDVLLAEQRRLQQSSSGGGAGTGGGTTTRSGGGWGTSGGTSSGWGASSTNQQNKDAAAIANDPNKLQETVKHLDLIDLRLQLDAWLDVEGTFPPTQPSSAAEKSRRHRYVAHRIAQLAASSNLASFNYFGGDPGVWNTSLPSDPLIVIHILRHRAELNRMVKLAHEPAKERELSLCVGHNGVTPCFFVRYANPPSVYYREFHPASGSNSSNNNNNNNNDSSASYFSNNFYGSSAQQQQQQQQLQESSTNQEQLFHALLMFFAIIHRHHNGSFGAIMEGVVNLEKLKLTSLFQ